MIPYSRIAREAIPVAAGCYVCQDVNESPRWLGKDSRTEALAHRDAEGHPVWIECKPKED
jgi:hypothetical protein